MKNLNIVRLMPILLGVALMGGSYVPMTYAATSPSLGAVSPYEIVSSTYTNSLNAALETAITGSICYTTGPGTTPISISGATDVPCAAGVGTDQTAALANLNAQSCTDLGVNVVLSGTYTPGCYSSSGTMDITLGTTVTLSGAGTYIFRAGGALTTGANSKVVATNGACASDVFWTPVGATTLGANSSTQASPTFLGNIFRGAAGGLSITLGKFVNLEGRTLAFGSTVTTDSNTMKVPTCVSSSGGGEGPLANYYIIKNVVNKNGSTGVASNFTVHVRDTKNSGFDVINAPEVAGSPAPGIGSPGTLYKLPQGTYTVREDVNPLYSVSYSGGCDAAGNISLQYGDNRTCTITNTRIVAPVPPLINVVKVPNPLVLPGGPGPVTYTYTATNIGIVPMTNVALVGDTCSPIVRISGDTNGDNKLDVTETWKFSCSTTLTATHTNTVTATGRANGFTAIHTAQATVVVGASLIPPLIHVVKVPDPLTLPAGGGAVTYRYTVTNPGIAPLSNVSITDNKCTGLPGRVIGHPGDLNKNDLLEPGERWSFTCISNLTKTTTNTATTTGSANA